MPYIQFVNPVSYGAVSGLSDPYGKVVQAGRDLGILRER